MNPAYCDDCKWFYIRTIKRRTDYMCSYSRYHQTGMKFGRLVNIKRIKKQQKNVDAQLHSQWVYMDNTTQ